MRYYIPFLTLLLLSCGTSGTKNSSLLPEKDESQGIPTSIQKRLSHFLSYSVDSVAFPRSVEPSGEVRGVPSKDWTSGFYVGSLLYANRISGEKEFLDHALAWLPYLEKEKENNRTHDMGFKVDCSYGNAYEMTGEESFREVVIASAKTLATRFNPAVGCIKSWDFGTDVWDFPVIIDNMMNLELLFQATAWSGDSTFHKIAVSHADQTIKNHFRADNSSVHVVDYDPATGEVIKTLTHQGYNDSSAWARGQAWGLYGYTMSYRFTQHERYLSQAEKIATYILNHPRLPDDMIPYWDFDAPDIPNEPRDASAAAIIASALIELSTHTQKEEYLVKARNIVQVLQSDSYVLSDEAKVPFILNHCTGNWPKTDEIDAPLSYADYYLMESIYRLKNLPQ